MAGLKAGYIHGVFASGQVGVVLNFMQHVGEIFGGKATLVDQLGAVVLLRVGQVLRPKVDIAAGSALDNHWSAFQRLKNVKTTIADGACGVVDCVNRHDLAPVRHSQKLREVAVNVARLAFQLQEQRFTR